MKLKLTSYEKYQGYTEEDLTITTAMWRIQRQARKGTPGIDGIYDIETGEVRGWIQSDMWFANPADKPEGVRIEGSADCSLREIAKAIARYKDPKRLAFMCD